MKETSKKKEFPVHTSQKDEVKLNVLKEKEAVQEHPATKEERVDVGFIKRPFFWQITSVILLVLFIVSLFSAFSGVTGYTVKDLGSENAREQVKEYVDAVLQGRFVADIGPAVEDGGLYKILVQIQGQEITSYVTKDGRLFFPTVVDLEQVKALGGVPALGVGAPQDEGLALEETNEEGINEEDDVSDVKQLPEVPEEE